MPVSIAWKLTMGCFYNDWESSKAICGDEEPRDITAYQDMNLT